MILVDAGLELSLANKKIDVFLAWSSFFFFFFFSFRFLLLMLQGHTDELMLCVCVCVCVWQGSAKLENFHPQICYFQRRADWLLVETILRGK